MINLLDIRKAPHVELEKRLEEGQQLHQAIFDIVHKRIAVIAPTGQFYDVFENAVYKNDKAIYGMFTTTNAIQVHGQEVLTHIGDAIAKIPTIVMGVVSRPDKGIVFENEDGQSYANTFRRPPLNPVEPSAEIIQMLDDYFDFLSSGREEVKQYLINWCYQLVSNPSQRNQVALLLYGKSQGTGKGTLMSILTRLLGQANVIKPADSHEFMVGRFKSGLEGKLLLALDELYSEGNKVANKAKSLITEPVLELEGKGKDLRSVPMFFSTLATSNNTQPICLEQGDRRWTCINVEFPNPNQNGSHADNTEVHQKVVKVAEWVHTGSDEVICNLAWYFDTNSDLSQFQIGTPLDTAEKLAILEGSADLSTTVFQEFIETVSSTNKLFIQSTELFNDEALSKYRYANPRRKALLESADYIAFPEIRLNDGSKKKGLYLTPKGAASRAGGMTEADMRGHIKQHYAGQPF